MEQSVTPTKIRSFISKAFHVACGIGAAAVLADIFNLYEMLTTASCGIVIGLGLCFALGAIQVLWEDFRG